jgi:putative sterol carrier protein
MTATIAELMSKMPDALIPEKAAGIDATIQFKFSGADTGEWFVTIKDKKCQVEQGTFPTPKMTLAADSADYLKIVSGELDGMQAFMQGKLKLNGDLSLAVKLMGMFKIS